MNIFVLHQSPKVAAVFHNNKHVIKMCLETAQLLCTVLSDRGINESWLYKPTHRNHPCTIWARQNPINYDWLCRLGIELCKEYTHRYGKRHKSQDIIELCQQYSEKSGTPTNFALAMPDHCKISNNPIECYREYYRVEKRNMADWSGKVNSRPKPNWYF